MPFPRHQAAPGVTRATPTHARSRGADPNVETEDYEPYLNPGRKTPIQIAQENMREKLAALEEKYKASRV